MGTKGVNLRFTFMSTFVAEEKDTEWMKTCFEMRHTFSNEDLLTELEMSEPRYNKNFLGMT
jgi:hypothetical protein